MPSINIIGKWLDQPVLLNKMSDKIPYVLTAGGVAYGAYDTYKAPEKERKNTFIKNTMVLSLTIISSLIATRGKIFGKKLFKEGLMELPDLLDKKKIEQLEKGIEHNHSCCSCYEDHREESIVKFLHELEHKKDKNPENIIQLVEKVKKNECLTRKEVETLNNELERIYPGENKLNEIIPPPHSHGAFAELGKLSLIGLIPIIGGITGGILGDKFTGDDWKKKLPNKVKEGLYQYLSNIFMCNIGAGLALLAMNKAKITSKPAKLLGMLAGVVSVGILGGGIIANWIGKNILNPLLDGKKTKSSTRQSIKDLNSERHPELIDMGIHIDDLASVGFLAGLKWVGPILPILYSVSAYRAGIGYRNGDK